nr:MAG TPA: Transcriptional regulatory protein RcsB factor, DNA BINDING PROTEIN.6A [Caudoviricetes sp.]
MAVNTSTYGIPHNCKNWLALASVVWGNLDINEAIKVIGGKGSGLPKKVSIQDEFKLIDKVIECCKNGLTNRQIMDELNLTSNQVTRAKIWGDWINVSKEIK